MKLFCVALLCCSLTFGKKAQAPQMSPLDEYVRDADQRTSGSQERSSGSLWSPDARLGDLVVPTFGHGTLMTSSRSSSKNAHRPYREAPYHPLRTSSANAHVDAALGPRKSGWLPNLASVSGQRKLDGQGETVRETVLNTVLTARVTNVLPNGNLVVEAAKSVTVNSETQRVLVRGVVRPFDLTTANVIQSDQIAMLEVSVAGKGVVADAVRATEYSLPSAAWFTSLLIVMKKLIVGLMLAATFSSGASRLKELVNIEGVRENQLVGYGLVVGLNGTGDRRQTLFSAQSLSNMLQQMGVTVPAQAMRVTNTAAVMVTGTLPPYARPGARIDVTAAAIGDALNLQGGLLVMTSLRGIDGQVYAIAQGPLVTAGLSPAAAATSRP